jgi:hypothetical protein
VKIAWFFFFFPLPHAHPCSIDLSLFVLVNVLRKSFWFKSSDKRMAPEKGKATDSAQGKGHGCSGLA